MSQASDSPFVLWDGDCGFCRHWIDHWRDRVGPKVQFRAVQDVDEVLLDTHGIERGDVLQAMHFVDSSGRVHVGAGAVFELLALSPELRYRALRWAYERLRSFRAAADFAYRLIARDRPRAARVTALLWGTPHRSTFQFSRFAFLRLLAAATFAAFWSMSIQIEGLLGADGILPARELLGRARGAAAELDWTSIELFSRLPTVFLWDTSDAALTAVCAVGMACSTLLFFGVVPRLVLPVLWLLYLSICSVGQVFLGYQWDSLLLEALFLAWFVAPWAPLPRRRWSSRTSPVGRWFLWLLVFKLMFMAGLVKVMSDPVWRDLTALNYHFWTQPIPNAGAAVAHRLPEVVKSFGVAFTLLAEVAAPLLIFAPRRLRHFGGMVMIALQVAIVITGVYGFFNLLTIALCVMLFDDRFFFADGAGRFRDLERAARGRRRVPGFVTSIVIVPLILLPMDSRRLGSEGGELRQEVEQRLAPFRTFNGYGLFAHMTKERPEIVVEVTSDEVRWAPVEFRYKPTPVNEPLPSSTLHMPRLDWQMWFAALGGCRRNPWFLAFQRRLIEGSEPVLTLLEGASSGTVVGVRSSLFRYRFGDEEVWERERVGQYCPPIVVERSRAGEIIDVEFVPR